MRPEPTEPKPAGTGHRASPRPSFFLDRVWPFLLLALAFFKLADWWRDDGHDPLLLVGGIGFLLLAAGAFVRRSPRARRTAAASWLEFGLALAGLVLVLVAIVLHDFGPFTAALATG